MFLEAFPLPQEQGGTIPLDPDPTGSAIPAGQMTVTIRRSWPLFNRKLPMSGA